MSKRICLSSFVGGIVLALSGCGGAATPDASAGAAAEPATELAKADQGKPDESSSMQAPAPEPVAPQPREPSPPPAAQPRPPAPAPALDPALDTMRAFIAAQKIDKSADDWKTTLQEPPLLAFEPARQYFWVLDTTEGTIKVHLLPDVAPQHVSSTIYLTELGFYDGLPFHRVIPGFMAQGGDPLGTGRGNPGYKYAGEFSPTVKHDRPGLLSMANAGPGTDGSQFFLTFVPTPHLDGKHTIFGEVVEGLDSVTRLEQFGSKPGGQTSKRLEIVKATIVAQ